MTAEDHTAMRVQKQPFAIKVDVNGDLGLQTGPEPPSGRNNSLPCLAIGPGFAESSPRTDPSPVSFRPSFPALVGLSKS